MNPLGPASSPARLVHLKELEKLENLDPTLAQDRTLLAWTRTGLSFLAVGGTVIKADHAAGSAILGIGGVVWFVGYLQDWTARRRGSRPSRESRVRIVAAATMFVSAVALVVALFEGEPFGH